MTLVCLVSIVAVTIEARAKSAAAMLATAVAISFHLTLSELSIQTIGGGERVCAPESGGNV